MSETWKPGPWTLNGKATNASLLDAAQDLYEALDKLTTRYVRLADSGDCGHWDTQEDDEVIAANAALAKARGA